MCGQCCITRRGRAAETHRVRPPHALPPSLSSPRRVRERWARIETGTRVRWLNRVGCVQADRASRVDRTYRYMHFSIRADPGVTPLLILRVPFRMERCLKSKVSAIVLYLDIAHMNVRSGKIVMRVGHVAGNVAVTDVHRNLCSLSWLRMELS